MACARRQHQGARQRAGEPQRKNAVDTGTPDIAGSEQVAGAEAEIGRQHRHRHHHRRHAVGAREHAGADQEEADEAAIEKRKRQRVGAKAPRTQHGSVAGEHARQADGYPLVGRMGLAVQAKRERHQKRAHHGATEESGAPAEPGQHRTAHQRRHRGRDRERDHDQRHRMRGVGPGVAVAHHGARNHQRDACAQALHDATGQQLREIGGQRGADAAEREYQHANEENAATPEHVGQRTTDQLAQRQRQRVHRHHPLHATLVDVELDTDRRQQGGDHVVAERRAGAGENQPHDGNGSKIRTRRRG